MRRSSSRRARIALIVGLAAPALGCQGPDYFPGFTIKGPTFGPNGTAFEPVSRVVESRCGTLDCHGATFRPLRIYGQFGLRRPLKPGEDKTIDFKNYYSGGSVPTTKEELLENYESMLGLEPELTQAVIDKEPEATPDTLTLFRKPRLTEKHKGGHIWNAGAPGDLCMAGWISGTDFTQDCNKEVPATK